MKYIIDTHAWVEYFIGSKKGEIVRKLFSQSHEFFTIECSLAEICGWSLKNNRDFQNLLRIVRANSQILNVHEKNWIDAAREKNEQRKKHENFGLIDSILLVKQKEISGRIISGDRHFKHFKNVVFLEDK